MAYCRGIANTDTLSSDFAWALGAGVSPRPSGDVPVSVASSSRDNASRSFYLSCTRLPPLTPFNDASSLYCPPRGPTSRQSSSDAGFAVIDSARRLTFCCQPRIWPDGDGKITLRLPRIRWMARPTSPNPPAAKLCNELPKNPRLPEQRGRDSTLKSRMSRSGFSAGTTRGLCPCADLLAIK